MKGVTTHSYKPASLTFPAPAAGLFFTGERYTSDTSWSVRRHRHHRYLFASHFCTGRDVLDLVCREGYGSAVLGVVARKVHGLDLNPQSIAFAERHYARTNVSFRQGNVTHLEDHEIFDVAIGCETITHQGEWGTFIAAVRRALRPGGLLILSFPDRAFCADTDHCENMPHARSVDLDEFKDLIGQQFANVVVLKQESIVSSLMVSQKGVVTPLELFSSEEGPNYFCSSGMLSTHSFIVLASDNPLPRAFVSMLDGTSWIHMLQDDETHAAALHGEIFARDTAIVGLRQKIFDLDRSLEQQQKLNDEQEQYLNRIISSKSWRLIEPVRRIATKTARFSRRVHDILLTTIPVRTRQARHPADPPRVLFVDFAVPTPDQDSGSVDLWHQLCLFQTLGYDVAFLPIVGRSSDDRYVAALHRVGVIYLGDEAHGSSERLIKEKAGDFDLIFLNRVHVASRLIAHIRRCAPNSRIVFNTVDLHFLREEREAALEGSRKKAREAAWRREEELRCVADSDATIVLSAAEGRLLSSLMPRAKIHVIPFARGTSNVVPPFRERSGILFVGGFSHAPNVDAVQWLVTEIWPNVRRVLPTAMLEIVGSNTPLEIQRLDAPRKGVHVRGYVQNLDSVLSNVKLTIAPLRFGAGIKGKVAASLAAGVPCVATPIATEGMGLTDGETILVGGNAEELAEAIVRAHEDAILWAKLSNRGLAVMRERYSPEQTGQRFLYLVRSLGVPMPESAEKKLSGVNLPEWNF